MAVWQEYAAWRVIIVVPVELVGLKRMAMNFGDSRFNMTNHQTLLVLQHVLWCLGAWFYGMWVIQF